MTNPRKSPRIAVRPKQCDPTATTVVLVVSGGIARAEIEMLCTRARALMDGSDADLVVCDVGSVVADAVTVDALARLQITARRSGRRIRIAHASDELRDLMCLMGLTEALPLARELPLQSEGEAETREQSFRVEEEVQSDDPAP